MNNPATNIQYACSTQLQTAVLKGKLEKVPGPSDDLAMNITLHAPDGLLLTELFHWRTGQEDIVEAMRILREKYDAWRRTALEHEHKLINDGTEDNDVALKLAASLSDRHRASISGEGVKSLTKDKLDATKDGYFPNEVAAVCPICGEVLDACELMENVSPHYFTASIGKEGKVALDFAPIYADRDYCVAMPLFSCPNHKHTDAIVLTMDEVMKYGVFKTQEELNKCQH